MAKRNPVKFNTGVVRMIGGSCYIGSTHDSKGVQRVYKSGPQKGQPRTDFGVGIAIKKTQAHFANEPGWGQAIWAEGHAAWPAGQAQRPDFAWKVIDGDSTIPNNNMKRPCDQPGYPGHWILWFGGTTPPATADGRGIPNTPAAWSNEPNLIMPGDYVEVSASVVGNEAESPGVYLNIEAICLRGYHPEGRIAQRIDLASAGFGAALPAGASVAPVGNAMPPVPAPGAQPSTPGAPPPPVAQAPVAYVPPVPVTTTPPVPVLVTPNPATLGAPAPVTVPPAPVPSPVVVPPPAPASVIMKNGGDYNAWKAAGWTDDALRAAGHI
jgi:hypothetical protein